MLQKQSTATEKHIPDDLCLSAALGDAQAPPTATLQPPRLTTLKKQLQHEILINHTSFSFISPPTRFSSSFFSSLELHQKVAGSLIPVALPGSMTRYRSLQA